MREIKFSCMWSDGEKWIDNRYSLVEMENGDHWNDMSDQPFMEQYKLKHKRQYTGQKDKNGKEIYEGDIVANAEIDGSYHKCIVRYSERLAKFIFSPACEEWDFDRCVVGSPFHRKEYEVIGNIYENPELIKVA